MTSRGLIPASMALLLCGAPGYAAPPGDASVRAAAWLSGELHLPVTAQQIRSAPELASFDGCKIRRAAAAATGGTSLELRCPEAALPQILLVAIAPPRAKSNPVAARSTRPLIRAGTRLQADWRTPAMHAVLPVVALEAGTDGAEIRVRLAGGQRIYRALVISAHSVKILCEGS